MALSHMHLLQFKNTTVPWPEHWLTGVSGYSGRHLLKHGCELLHIVEDIHTVLPGLRIKTKKKLPSR